MTEKTTVTENYWFVRRYFAEMLKLKRIEQRLSVQNVCLALDVKQHTYRTWERGEHAPDLKMLQRICLVLKTSPNELLPNSIANGNGIKKQASE